MKTGASLNAVFLQKMYRWSQVTIYYIKQEARLWLASQLYHLIEHRYVKLVIIYLIPYVYVQSNH